MGWKTKASASCYRPTACALQVLDARDNSLESLSLEALAGALAAGALAAGRVPQLAELYIDFSAYNDDQTCSALLA